MAYTYEAKHSNGQTYNVDTDQHHSSYSDRDFKEHLHNVIQSTFSTVAGGYILSFLLKKRP